MIWALLALLGVPIWLIIGALIVASVSRRRFQRSEGVFPLRIREASATKFQRKAHGRWVHDVLLVNKGLALVLTNPYGVRSLDLHAEVTEPIKGLGDDPLVFDIRIDDGIPVVVAIPAEQRDLGVGPFGASLENQP